MSGTGTTNAPRAIGRIAGAELEAASEAGEAGRAHLRDRLVLFSKTMALLALLGYVMTVIVTGTGSHAGASALLGPSSLAHLAAIGVFAGVWGASRSVRPSLRRLRALDAIGTFVPAALLDVMAGTLPVHARPDLSSRHLVMLLVTTNLLIARAVLVPSGPVRTALLGSVTALAAVVGAALVDAPGRPGMRAMYAITWSAIAVLTSTLTSRVIYGLRQKVREAIRLGRYRLVEKIGAGGMGVVYRAEHAMLRRPTAIKLLDRNQVGRHSLARFEREVQLTASLTHPNTIAIFDYGHTPDGIFYYAMEYLAGLDLEQLVRRHGPQPVGRIVHLIRQACGSLAEAHAVGLVHRDIKPSNLVVTLRPGQGDVLKVLDFGLVKDARESEERLGSSGAILGTPLYMSPEAIANPDAVGPASDLYALGAVAYVLLTGRPVFQKANVVQVLHAHVSEPPTPPSRLGVSVPEAFERLIMRCLEKKPEHRPASALALEQELAHLDVPPWTRMDAERWWKARDEASDPQAPTATDDPAYARTLASLE